MRKTKCPNCKGSTRINSKLIPESQLVYDMEDGEHVEHLPDMIEWECKNCDMWWFEPAVRP